MTTEPTATLTLTHNEFVAVLQLLGTALNRNDALPGNETQEQGLEGEYVQIGLHTLAARGLIQLDAADTPRLDDTLLALVGSCALPEAQLNVAVQALGQAPQNTFFCATPYTLVELSEPYAGIFALDELATPAALQTRLATLLAPLAALPAPAQPAAYTLDAAQFNAALAALLQGNTAEAQQTLHAAGIALEHAATLTDPALTLWQSNALWGLTSEATAQVAALLVLATPRTSWIVRTVDANGERVELRAVRGAEAVSAVQAMAAPLTALSAPHVLSA